MAVKPANSNYHTFTFNGVRAADYGIYVTDVNVFNSAARDVEYIQIPGRDGAFALDRGRFQNISVVYKCAMTQDTDEDFATAISEFRNAIASTKGYKRLEDDIHTDEYRMGVFSKGLEAPTLNTKTATFDVEFNCQPQRFLKSGETAVSVASGGTLTNPTLFESHPLLQVWGYGELAINGEQLRINSTAIGHFTMDGSYTTGYLAYYPEYFLTNNYWQLNTGDKFYVIRPYFNIYVTGDDVPTTNEDFNVTTNSTTWVANDKQYGLAQGERAIYFRLELPNIDDGIEFVYGTNEIKSITITVAIPTTQTTIQFDFEIDYRAPSRLKFSKENVPSGTEVYHITYFREIYGVSTKSALGEPLYFDLDVGEAYKIEDDQIISVNNAVTIPAQLPTLKSGVNNITYDNTITQFKIVPRWWEV